MAPYIFQTGDDLLQLIGSLTNESKFQRRDFVAPLIGFCTDNNFNAKIGVIFGLRSTGKTVGMLQAAEFLMQQGKKVGYARFNYQEHSMDIVNSEIAALAKAGYTHLFIDEAPYLKHFLNHSAEWPDLFVPLYRLKIIITGTDSFLLWFALHRALYHRYECFLTNRNTFPESKRLLGQSYDEYKAQGGLFLAEGDTVSELLAKDAHIENFIRDAIIESLIHTLEQIKNDFATAGYYLDWISRVDKRVISKYIFELLESTAEAMIKKRFVKNASEQGDSWLNDIISDWSAHAKSGDRDRVVDQIQIYLNLFHNDNPKESINALLEFLINIGVLIEGGSSFSDLSKMQSRLCFAHPAIMSYALDKAKNSIIQAVNISDASAFSRSLAEASECALNENIVYCHFIRFSDDGDKTFLYHDKKGREIDIASVNRKLNRLRLVEVESKSEIDDSTVFENEAKALYDKEILKSIGMDEKFSITRIIAYKGENKRVSNDSGDLLLLNIEDLLRRIKNLDVFIEEI